LSASAIQRSIKNRLKQELIKKISCPGFALKPTVQVKREESISVLQSQISQTRANLRKIESSTPKKKTSFSDHEKSPKFRVQKWYQPDDTCNFQKTSRIVEKEDSFEWTEDSDWDSV